MRNMYIYKACICIFFYFNRLLGSLSNRRNRQVCASSPVTPTFDSWRSKCCLLCLGFESSSVTIQYSKKVACNTALYGR